MWVAENSVIHVDRSEKSSIHIDWAARPTWMTEFSSAYILCLLRGIRVCLKILKAHWKCL
jgi:hypothetical protein